jgi:hypothetical protein
MHKRRYRTEDSGGALGVSGRYNLGLDRFDEEESFAALYLATGLEICVGGVYRHVTRELLTAVNDFGLR